MLWESGLSSPFFVKRYPERPGQFCIQKQRRVRINRLPQTGNAYEIMRFDGTETVFTEAQSACFIVLLSGGSQ